MVYSAIDQVYFVLLATVNVVIHAQCAALVTSSSPSLSAPFSKLCVLAFTNFYFIAFNSSATPKVINRMIYAHTYTLTRGLFVAPRICACVFALAKSIYTIMNVMKSLKSAA